MSRSCDRRNPRAARVHAYDLVTSVYVLALLLWHTVLYSILILHFFLKFGTMGRMVKVTVSQQPLVPLCMLGGREVPPGRLPQRASTKVKRFIQNTQHE